MKYTFIVPVYNAEKHINKCITSIINQTYKNFEIIIINDGSTDNSLKIINIYKNKNIKIYNQKNEGVSSARNKGLDKASGDYIIFVDADDHIEKTMLSFINKQIIKNRDINILKYDYREDNNNKRKLNKNKVIINLLSGVEAFKLLVKEKKPFDLTCIYAFNKTFMNDNNFRFELNRSHEDFGLIPYIIIKSNKILITNKVLYNYVQTDNSITRNKDYQKQLYKFKDILYHFDNLYKKIAATNVEKKTFNSYIANAVLLNYKGLKIIDKIRFREELKKRNVINLLLDNTMVRRLKKKIYKILI